MEEGLEEKYKKISDMNDFQIVEMQKTFIILCVKQAPEIWDKKNKNKRKRGKQIAKWYEITGKLN